ncbi:MAG: hypothetical protein Ct9H90mP16_14060 [Candidatus Poseidoniales archaeon]|nr:MAG: hypothetical protein Ct9H90mP16_14060 [Candidatus Poseidoniales archaeon]
MTITRIIKPFRFDCWPGELVENAGKPDPFPLDLSEKRIPTGIFYGDKVPGLGKILKRLKGFPYEDNFGCLGKRFDGWSDTPMPVHTTPTSLDWER